MYAFSAVPVKCCMSDLFRKYVERIYGIVYLFACFDVLFLRVPRGILA